VHEFKENIGIFLGMMGALGVFGGLALLINGAPIGLVGVLLIGGVIGVAGWFIASYFIDK
tara:strand:- start:321 stop:500 length:180 start_codon:yes stop_codon:yes gene_type:complete